MAQEDALCSSIRCRAKQHELENKAIEIGDMTKRINEFEIQLKLERAGIKQRTEISLETLLFNFVDDDISRRKNNIRKTTAQNGDPDIREKIYIKTGKEISVSQIDMQQFTYLRPNYRALVDSIIPKVDKLMFCPPFPVWLQVVIRAIFDAKYNEMLYNYDQGCEMTRFPEFVFSWLGTFYISKDTHEVKLQQYIEKEVLTTENRTNILFGLEASFTSKLWEISIFRDFLNETLSLYDLSFFLHCRFLIVNVPQFRIDRMSFV